MQYKVVKYGIGIVIVNIEEQIVKNRYINNSINNYKVNKTKHKDIKQNNYKYHQLVDRLKYKHNQIIKIIHINKQLLQQIIKDIQKIIKI